MSANVKVNANINTNNNKANANANVNANANRNNNRNAKQNHSTNELPVEPRSCTDIFCAIIFVFFILATIASSVYGFINGNLDNVLQPYDEAGNACGRGKLETYPYVYWTDSASKSMVEKTVCVKKCPKGPNEIIECSPTKTVPT